MSFINKKMNLGNEGESFVVEFLKKNGYKVLERNWRRPFGEIDIVAMAGNGTLVFVEVKTMGYWQEGIQPEDQMTRAKMEKFKRAAEAYAGANSKLINDEKGWRCDVAALTKIGNNFFLKHYENV
jgi:putative endonuclease